jgi:sugar phosphate isomerase/epimerase
MSAARELGIFSRIFPRRSVAEVFQAVAEHGLGVVQWNFQSAGLATLPDAIRPALVEEIQRAMRMSGVRIAAVSGTFNLIDPIEERRRDCVERLRGVADAAAGLGAAVVTLCSGTRDLEDMWRWHEENTGAEAWSAMERGFEEVLEATEGSGVTLAFEPELANVASDAARALRVLETFQTPRLAVVIDPANLFPAGALARQHAIMEEAFRLLGPWITLAHAKDLERDGEAGQAAPGRGKLDFSMYARELDQVGYDGPWVIHGLSESEVGESVAFLRRVMSEAGEG